MTRYFASILALAAVSATVTPVWAQSADSGSVQSRDVSATPSGTAPTLAVPDNYRLDTDDTILIDVARHADVSRSLRIPTDGYVRLPRLLKPVQARGKTVAELTDLLSERLVSEGRLVLRPGQVSVAVSGLRARRVFIRGSAAGGKV
ncbi:MAG: polysaccharide biosynthesis/export family protein, partial [Armatimonadota bacterium]